MVKLVLENYITSYYQITEVSVGAQYSTACKKERWQEVKLTGWPGCNHDIKIEKSKSQRKSFHTGKLKKKKLSVYIAIVKLRRNFWNLLRTFYPYFLDVYIKMGKKEPIVERMETFERKQHYHAPCAINC